MIDLNKKSETFVKKSSRNNSKLYLVNNLNDLLSSKLFSEKQLNNFKTNYKFNSDKPIINLFDFAIDPYNRNLATPPSGKMLNLMCVNTLLFLIEKIWCELALTFVFERIEIHLNCLILLELELVPSIETIEGWLPLKWDVSTSILEIFPGLPSFKIM